MPKMEGFDKVASTLNRLAKKYGDAPTVSVIVGYTSAYAVHVHENIEMKWRGFPRDMSVRLIKGIAVTGFNSGGSGSGKGLFWEGGSGGQGQAKFLEQPARELKREFSKIIVTACSRGAKLEQALLMAGLRLQRESQQLVPVDTGNLKASAFTRKE